MDKLDYEVGLDLNDQVLTKDDIKIILTKMIEEFEIKNNTLYIGEFKIDDFKKEHPELFTRKYRFEDAAGVFYKTSTRHNRVEPTFEFVYDLCMDSSNIFIVSVSEDGSINELDLFITILRMFAARHRLHEPLDKIDYKSVLNIVLYAFAVYTSFMNGKTEKVSEWLSDLLIFNSGNRERGRL